MTPKPVLTSRQALYPLGQWSSPEFMCFERSYSYACPFILTPSPKSLTTINVIWWENTLTPLWHCPVVVSAEGQGPTWPCLHESGWAWGPSSSSLLDHVPLPHLGGHRDPRGSHCKKMSEVYDTGICATQYSSGNIHMAGGQNFNV